MRRIGMALTCAALLLGACGGDDATQDAAATDTGAAEALDTTAGGRSDIATELPDDAVVDATLNEWSIVLSRDTVDAGPISFRIRNAGTMVHRFEVEGQGEEVMTDDLQPGGEITMSLTLQPGTYDVYCPITNGQSHAERGMRTQLHVR